MSEYVSDHLKEVSRRLKEHRHGGLVLTGDGLESFINRMDQIQEMARDLENALSKSEWNKRATLEKITQAKRLAQVLAAVQIPESNVMLFPIAPRPVPRTEQPQGGGDAA